MSKKTKILSILFLPLFLYSCQTTTPVKSVHGDKPLIDTSKIVEEGLKQIERKVEDGPKPKEGEEVKAKRKTITTQNVKNYVSIPEEYTNLKQKISINFQSLDFKFAMSL